MSVALIGAAEAWGWEPILRSRYRVVFRRGTEVVWVVFSTTGRVVQASHSVADARQRDLKQSDKRKQAIVLSWLAQPSEVVK